MCVSNVFNPQEKVSCIEWLSAADECTKKIVKDSCSILSVSFPVQFSSVSIMKKNPTDDKISPFVKSLGKCFIFNTTYANIVLPFFSQKASVQPVIFVDPSYATLPDPVKTIMLSYAFFFIDWHIRMRAYVAACSLSGKEERALQVCGLFFSEYESFKLYLRACAQAGRELDIPSIKKGCTDYESLEIGVDVGRAVEYLAKVAAMTDFNASFCAELKEDKTINDFFTEKLGSLWEKLRDFFSNSRTFDQAVRDYADLDSILAGLDQSPESLQKIDELRIKSAQAFSSGKYENAAKICEQYISELKRIRADSRQVSFALGNLHTYYIGAKKYEKAASIMPELNDYAEMTRDFISLAYAHLNSLQDSVLFMDEKRSIEQLRLCVDAVSRFTEDERRGQERDIKQILNTLAQYLIMFAGAPEIKPLEEKLLVLYKLVAT